MSASLAMLIESDALIMERLKKMKTLRSNGTSGPETVESVLARN